MATITPCLWFDGDGLDAAEFSVSLFPDSRIDGVSPGPDGTPLVISFTLMGRPFQALNGGPQYTAGCRSHDVDDQARSGRHGRSGEGVR